MVLKAMTLGKVTKTVIQMGKRRGSKTKPQLFSALRCRGEKRTSEGVEKREGREGEGGETRGRTETTQCPRNQTREKGAVNCGYPCER